MLAAHSILIWFFYAKQHHEKHETPFWKGHAIAGHLPDTSWGVVSDVDQILAKTQETEKSGLSIAAYFDDRVIERALWIDSSRDRNSIEIKAESEIDS